MCGILVSTIKTRKFKTALESLSHRGPDDSGEHHNGVSLGHRRLSIIDIGGGHQPMTDGRYTIVFNGEIYNYVELKKKYPLGYKTNTDTEVILVLYAKFKEKCLPKLNGMFAFAIWDSQEKTLFCARDRIGEKPFFYGEIDGKFVGASEIKSLLALGIRPVRNKQVEASYLSHRLYDHTRETFYEGIRSLPPGSYMKVKNGEIVESKKYWTIRYKKPSYRNIEEAIDEFSDLLRSSILMRLRSDVPTGLNLSSGLDSNVLLFFIDHLLMFNPEFRPKLFTLSTPSKEYDEKKILERYLTQEQRDRWFTTTLQQNKVWSRAKDMARTQDQPYGGIPTIGYGKLCEEIQRQGIKVVLEGQGLDELLCGYPHYLSSRNLRKTQRDDLLRNKLPRVLRFNDHASMKYGIELRQPYLDHRIIEFCYSLPDEYKIKNGIQKVLVRKMMSYLPLSKKKKKEFGEIQVAWMRGGLKDKIQKLIKKSPYMTEELRKRIDGFWRGEGDNSFFLWQIINLELIKKNGQTTSGK